MSSHASHSQLGKRTNSLAFAAMDCHTCASNGHKCDRQRPQCTTCLDQGQKCGGFAMPLSWDERRTWLGQTSRNKSLRTAPEEGDDVQRSSVSQHGDTTSPNSNPRNFRFVLNGKKTRKRRKVVQSRKENTPGPVTAAEAVTEDCLPALDGTNLDNIFLRGQQVDPFPELASLAASEQWLDDPGNALFLNDTFDLSSSLDYFATLLPPELSAPSVHNPITMDRDPAESLTGPGGLPADAFPEALASLVHQGEASVEGGGVLTTQRSPVASGSGARLVPSAPVGSQSDALLQMYDSEFCVLPITSDTELNPFRFRQPLSQAPRVLFHSIFALCCRHLSQLTGSWSSEEREHRSQASKLLESALKIDQLARRGLTLLDPILILFTLDCTISASGRWSTHLSRVRSILETCGGATALNNARLRSQVAMMLWWDATLALVSRQGTVFSQQYLDHVAREEKNDRWSFYDLTGCPSDLVIYIFKLAQLAQQSEIASSMTWLTFDLNPVVQIESQLRAWKHFSFTAPEYSATDDSYDDSDKSERDGESAFHARQDRHHVAEAWRHALLLYIERIFRWDRSQKRPRSIKQLARLTLNHVRCCRRTSQMQKQLLLPVFLAGSETGDEDMQDLVRGYCHWWGKRSRYNMFHSVPALLEDIWGGGKWWGLVVDEKTKGAIGENVSMQFLFG